jgi:hypothetical protein
LFHACRYYAQPAKTAGVIIRPPRRMIKLMAVFPPDHSMTGPDHRQRHKKEPKMGVNSWGAPDYDPDVEELKEQFKAQQKQLTELSKQVAKLEKGSKNGPSVSSPPKPPGYH